MRIPIIFLCLMISMVLPAAAEGPKPAAPPVFTRERFDPARDPRADLDAVIAKKGRKNIILDVGGEWCGWCVYMDKFFFLNPDLTRLREDNFVWVKVNISEENENSAFLSAYPPAAGFPHLYVLDSEGRLLHSQDTGPLEQGKGYSLVRFTEFLKKWSPTRENEPSR